MRRNVCLRFSSVRMDLSIWLAGKVTEITFMYARIKTILYRFNRFHKFIHTFSTIYDFVPFLNTQQQQKPREIVSFSPE